MPRNTPTIDPLSPDLINIDEAAKLVPGRPHRHTVFRWTLHERRGHRLESILVSGRRYTTRQALREYLTAIAKATGSESRTYRGRASQQRTAQAKRRLAAAGI